MNLPLRFMPLILLLIFTPWTVTSANSSEVLELTEKDFQDVIDKHLVVFVLFYRPYDNLCMGQHQPGVGDFEVGAGIAKKNGMTEYLDLKFGKVNIQDQTGLATRYNVGLMTCSDPPKMILFRYGRAIEYGTKKLGQYVLSEHQLTTKGMFEFLEKRTEVAASVIQTEDELKTFVKGSEFTVVGYFQDDSKTKVVFWNVADRRKDYVWGAVTNKSMNQYAVDTIVVNHVLIGNETTRVILNKNLTAENIEEFVGMNAVAYGHIVEMTDKNFQDVIDRNLLVFVLFYDPSCEIPEYFETAARIAGENGLAGYLNMRFGKVNIKQGSRTQNKYNVSKTAGCDDQWKKMILFRYGKVIKYGSSSNGIVWHQKTETAEGLFEWLEKNTNPAAKIILSDYELMVFVEYTEVTILGYFKDSKARIAFWNVAEKLKDYKFGAVTNPYMNPYEMDTIVITQEYGISRLMLNENLNEENIEKLVKLNANSSFPVPTRILRPDRNETLDSYHRKQNIVFVYDGSFFFGNMDKVDLSKGCVDITGSWEQEVRSIKTFGLCVKVYDSFRCRSEVAGDPLSLNNSNIPVQHDLRIVGFHNRLRSIQSCDKSTSSTSDSNFNVNKLTLAIVASVTWALRNPKVLSFE